MAPPLVQKIYHKLSHPAYDIPYLVLLVLAEAILAAAVVLRIPYTEIDWVAYMQEVTAYQGGERDYVNIRGDTGPLVYPAGFLYLYGWLKSLAIGGGGGVVDVAADPLGLDGSTSAEAIRRIQWLFVALYLLNAAIVLALYHEVLRKMRQRQRRRTQQSPGEAAAVWYWRAAMGLTCLSKRVHSIFLLRLFNDAPAMALLHFSMYLFARGDAWALGCAAFSLAVSIKMNVLLFAPGLLLLLLQKSRCLRGTAGSLSICAAVQVLLGWPFLSAHPKSYVRKAFELDRVFFFEWTVNWKFLPEELFVSRSWALLLLVCHLGSLCFLARKWWRASISQRGGAKTREWLCWARKSEDNLQLSPEYVIYTMFVSNFIGIAFARTLHYQFYCWYFHSLPMMHLMATTNLSSKNATTMFSHMTASAVAISVIEYAFNVFPATGKSSVLLQLSHAFLLIKIFFSDVPSIEADNFGKRKSQ